MVPRGSIAPFDSQVVDPAWREALAGLDLPAAGWTRLTARALVKLLSNPPTEQQAFRWSVGHWCRHRDTLRQLDVQPPVLDTRHLSEDFPLVVTFVTYSRRPNPAPLATLLMRLVLELHLRGLHPATMLQVAETLRGMSQSAGLSPLEGSIGHAGTIRELQTVLGEIENDVGPKKGLTGHKAFDSLWRRELRAICEQLGKEVTADLNEDSEVEPEPLSRIRALGSGLSSGIDGLDLDDLPMAGTSPLEPGAAVPPNRAQVAASKALAFERHSSAELLRHPDHILPAQIVAECWRAACSVGEAAGMDGDIAGLEDQIALLLSIEAGLFDREVPCVAFGNSTEGGVLALDVEGQALRRPEVRPPKAFTPKAGEESVWLPTGGDTLFPLTDHVISLARQLMALRGKNPVLARCSLLVSRADSGNVRVIQRAIRRTAPHLPVTGSLLRSRLAAVIAETLGPDAAQLAFGETFGLSGAATYYYRPEAASIARCVWDAARQVTGAPAELPNPFVIPDHFLGSRAAPVNLPFAKHRTAADACTQKKRGRMAGKDMAAQWVTRRDKLAIHLMLAAACRPNRSLAQVRLGDLVPEHALVILADKTSDPAHLTRMASTGWGFVDELQNFLVFVRTVAASSSDTGLERVARKVLNGATPLFTTATPDGKESPLDVSALMASLPAPWCSKPNLHRHLLCNALAAAGVDPELRYFQMGWIVASANTAGECSPYSFIEASAQLADKVDGCLATMGWGSGENTGNSFDWRELPPLQNWERDLENHQGAFKDQCRHLRTLLAEHRQEAKPVVHQELRRAFAEILPQYKLKLLKGHTVLRREDSGSPATEDALVGEGIVRTILERFDGPSFTALHQMIAISELARLLREGVRNGFFKAYVPSVPVLSLSREPSPVIRGSGLAVRQAQAIRRRIIELAHEIDSPAPKDRTEALALLTWLGILCFSPYRTIDQARQILGAGTQHCHSDASLSMIRIPLASGHGVLSGEAALLVQRLKATEGAEAVIEKLDTATLCNYLKKEMGSTIPRADNSAAIIKMLEQTLQVAGRIELSGIERTIMLGSIQTALVSAERAASAEDQVTIPDAKTGDALPDDSDDPKPASARPPRKNPSHRSAEKDVVEKLLPYFSPDYQGEIDGKAAEASSARTPQLIAAATSRLQSLGRQVTASLLLLEYLLHLLSDGGPRSSGRLKLSSIYTMLNRFARPLIHAAGPSDLEEISQVGMTTLLHTIIMQAPFKMRVRVLAEVRQFFDYSAHRYDLEAPEWAVLYAAAGERWEGRDPAVVSDKEIERVAQQLAENVQTMSADLSLRPSERRVRELQLLGLVLLEASGCRPRSIHGLTLADIHLNASGDHIHLKTRGRYASIKTTTSAGFISLEGHIWKQYRDWVAAWLAARRNGIEADALADIPVFQIPQAEVGTRFAMAAIFNRIGQLIRWSTGQTAGRTYWIRKRCIQSRHLNVHRKAQPRARDIFRALRESGHVLMGTPVGHYLGDAATFMAGSLRPSATLSRSQIADLSGVKAGTLDRRWQRISRQQTPAIELTPQLRLQEALALPSQPWSDFDPAPIGAPPSYSVYRCKESLLALSAAMDLLSQHQAQSVIADWTGLPIQLILKIQTCMDEFRLRSGISFGAAGAQIHKPRLVDVTKNLLDLLTSPDDRLHLIANEWVSLSARVSFDAGCALIDVAAITNLNEVLGARGFKLQEAISQAVPTYMPVAADGDLSYGIWPTLRWILAVTWVAGRLPGGAVSFARG